MPDEDRDKPGDSGHDEGKTQPLSTEATAAEPSSPMVSRRIGGYRIKRIIDSGGMGTVYEAVQEHPRRPVALKVMRPGIASRSALRRFETEAQILARLRHPNIAQVYEAGTHDDGHGAVPFFALEYIPSARPITQYARAKGLSARQRLELFVKVCDAVHHGHQKGIIHRDLKPGNILVDGSGEPKVIDFGVARTTDSDLALTTQQTDVGQLLGTVQYMSPEQVEADPHAIDGRSDVYALGVVLYELLADKLPYSVSGTPVVEAARIIKEEPPTRLSTLDTKLRGDLETIVLTALEKEPSRRYQSAHELSEDITRYLNDEPIVARRPTVWYILNRRTQVLLQRHPVGTTLAIILVATLLTGTIGGWLVHDWTPAFDMVKAAVAAPFWPAPPAPGLERVRVIRITDDTGRQVERLAGAHGFTDVDWDNFSSLRRLHGCLMSRLAEAGAKSVTWDMTFRNALPFDEDFVAGVEALREHRVDVVVSVWDWPLDPAEKPDISGNIAPSVCWGGSTTKFDGDEEWNIHLFMQRGTGDPKPSLVLRSLAAFRHPGAILDIDVDREWASLLLRYKASDPEGARQPRTVGEPELIKLTGADLYDDEPASGRRTGDLVGTFAFKLPSVEQFEAVSVDYEWVFDADMSALRQQFAGKAVVIGNFRAGVDRHAHARQGMVPGPYGHAAALDWLLAGRGIRNESDRVAWLSAVLGALLGVLIAGGATGRVPRRGALLVTAAIVYFFTSIFVYQALDYVLNPLVPLLAMLIASELAVGVNRARRARLA
jgi:tRNA A-37 threonylcarbamoyl transferase component Bud32/CHASE2 domain-containing sensor protein